MKQNVTALQDHGGPPFEYWRLRAAASYGAIPVDLIPQWLDSQGLKAVPSGTDG